MLRGRNNMSIMRLVYIRNNNYRPTKLKELVKSGEVDIPGTGPPLYSVVLKVSYVCRVYLNNEFGISVLSKAANYTLIYRMEVVIPPVLRINKVIVCHLAL